MLQCNHPILLFPQQYVCSYSKNGRGATATGVVTINSGDESSLMSAVATVGPISTYVDASHSAFQVGCMHKSTHMYLCEELCTI